LLRPLAALLAAWGVLALGGLPFARGLRALAAATGGEVVTLLLVQPDLPRGERWAENLQASHLAKIAQETERALGETGPAPDAVLWPENLLTSPLDRSNELSAGLRAAVDRLGVPVILGAVQSANLADADLHRSSVLWLEPGRGVAAEIDKTRAFPLLEASFSSRSAALVAAAFGGAARGKKVEEAATAGALRARGFSLAVVLCYETLFPELPPEGVEMRKGDGTIPGE
jgi:apolipoprotein N-acyltransferase